MVHYHTIQFPLMVCYVCMQEGNEGGELLGFNTVATKLLAVVTTPIHSALASNQDQVLLHLSSVYYTLIYSTRATSWWCLQWSRRQGSCCCLASMKWLSALPTLSQLFSQVCMYYTSHNVTVIANLKIGNFRHSSYHGTHCI